MSAACIVYSLDHLVLTVADIDATVAFYQSALGMRAEEFAPGRKALLFGDAKINLHQRGREFRPCAANPTPGSADLCFLCRQPVDEVAERLRRLGVPVEEGPVDRSGATEKLVSIYFRDPDGNLIEASNLASFRNQ